MRPFPLISLKAARVNAGYNLKDAAKALSVCDATLRNYETGSTMPDIETARKIEVLYDFPMDYIFLGKRSLKESFVLKKDKDTT